MSRSDAFDQIADAALSELSATRASGDSVGAAVAAAAMLATRAAHEAADRDRVIRIARREGATLRALADATGLSRQTISNICAAHDEQHGDARRSTRRKRAG